jgi:hypothetical protein
MGFLQHQERYKRGCIETYDSWQAVEKQMSPGRRLHWIAIVISYNLEVIINEHIREGEVLGKRHNHRKGAMRCRTGTEMERLMQAITHSQLL